MDAGLSSQGGRGRRLANGAPAMTGTDDLADAYQHSHRLVRARLLTLGIARADLEDVGHEVFLLALKQRQAAGEHSPGADWLHQACDLVALAYRRKAYRRREIPSELLEPSSPSIELEWPEPDQEESSASSAERLHRALAELSFAERELLALHLTAGMPFRALADIHACDVKTVRKRFTTASERLRRLLSGKRLTNRLTPVPASSETVRQGPRANASAVLRPFGMKEHVAISGVGNVLVSSWSGPVDQVSVDFLIESGEAFAREQGGRFAHLSIIEPESPPPAFVERQRLIEVAKFCKRHLAAFSMVASSNNHRLAEQLLRGVSFLVRANFLLYGAKNDLDGATWLVKQGYTFDADPNVSVAVLLHALAQTRALRAKH
jgi:RNA polymerase sigma factor (sigma-70 family)